MRPWPQLIGIVASAWAMDADALPSTPRATPWVDGSIAAGAGGGWLALALLHDDWARTTCPCDPSDVNRFDRPTIHLEWPRGELAANAVAGATFAGLLFGLVGIAPNAREWTNDTLLVAESVAVTGLLTQSIKTAVARPFPYMYSRPQPGQNENGVNYASFWSGHTAVPMAAVVTYAYLFQRKHPRSPWRWVLWTVGPALAITSGVLQMSAGNHFPTDVVAGAAAGATVGVANPWLHEW